MILQFGIVEIIFKIPAAQLMRTLLVTTLATIILSALPTLVVRPFLLEIASIPTNSMAPTVLAEHLRSTCPTCKKNNYGATIGDQTGFFEPRMICENFHVAHVNDFENHIYEGDQFLVARYLRPRRWDVITFRYPAQPEILQTRRVVGLPGETIKIRDGRVWINDRKVELPAHLKGITYLEGIPELSQITLWGTEKRPATLGRDEYFVLGDFSVQSVDSRLWEQGAEKHNAFAVPRSHVVGVVTHVFWPVSRFRILP